jgi:hypothetical protein
MMEFTKNPVEFMQSGSKLSSAIDKDIAEGKMDIAIGLIGNMTEEQAKATLIYRIFANKICFYREE